MNLKEIDEGASNSQEVSHRYGLSFYFYEFMTDCFFGVPKGLFLEIEYGDLAFYLENPKLWRTLFDRNPDSRRNSCTSESSFGFGFGSQFATHNSMPIPQLKFPERNTENDDDNPPPPNTPILQSVSEILAKSPKDKIRNADNWETDSDNWETDSIISTNTWHHQPHHERSFSLQESLTAGSSMAGDLLFPGPTSDLPRLRSSIGSADRDYSPPSKTGSAGTLLKKSPPKHTSPLANPLTKSSPLTKTDIMSEEDLMSSLNDHLRMSAGPRLQKESPQEGTKESLDVANEENLSEDMIVEALNNTRNRSCSDADERSSPRTPQRHKRNNSMGNWSNEVLMTSGSSPFGPSSTTPSRETFEKAQHCRKAIEQQYLELISYLVGRRKRQKEFLQTHPEDKWKSKIEKEAVTTEYQLREQALLRSRRLIGSLNDVKLIRRIGKGGFGEVYLAKKAHNHLSDFPPVFALKKISKENLKNKNQISHIEVETSVLSTSEHKDWLVHLLYTFQDLTNFYFAMEYVPGGDLKGYLDSFVILEEDEARQLTAEMFMAVHTLHLVGYIHRDLKPDNFLIDREGHLKLADFGLSTKGLKETFYEPFRGQVPIIKAVAPRSTPTRAKYQKSSRRNAYSLVGSPDYMAVEILREKGYDYTVDYWSIACIFFEMLCGETPFSSDTPHGVFSNVINWKDYLRNPEEDDEVLIPEQAYQFIQELICEAEDRLGKDSFDQITTHTYFQGIDWKNLRNVKAKFIPNLKDETDTTYFPESTDISEIESHNSGDSFLDKLNNQLTNPFDFEEISFHSLSIDNVQLEQARGMRSRSNSTASSNSNRSGISKHFETVINTISPISLGMVSKKLMRKNSNSSSNNSPQDERTDRVPTGQQGTAPLSLGYLSTHDWKILCTGARIVPFEKGEIIIGEGTKNDSLWRISNGSVEIQKHGQIIGRMGKGQVFGEMSFIESGSSATVSATVIAITKTEIYKISNRFIYSLFMIDGRLFLQFYKILTEMVADRAYHRGVSARRSRGESRLVLETPRSTNTTSQDDIRFQKKFSLSSDDCLIQHGKCFYQDLKDKKESKCKFYIGNLKLCLELGNTKKVFEYLHITRVAQDKKDSLRITTRNGAFTLWHIQSSAGDIGKVLQSLIKSNNMNFLAHNLLSKDSLDDSYPEETSLNLNESQWGRILDHAEQLHFQKDELILDSEHQCTSLYQVGNGSVRILDKQGQLVDTKGTAELFGEISFVLHRPLQYAVYADEPVDVWALPSLTLKGLFEKDPPLGGAFYRFLLLVISRQLKQIELDSEVKLPSPDNLKKTYFNLSHNNLINSNNNNNNNNNNK